ncbi:MAG TPA: hypothetical protein VM432_09310 [Bdellovibrionales bacterium]|nr:hypothetical protein [Bdellovibrionales bacterium]
MKVLKLVVAALGIASMLTACGGGGGGSTSTGGVYYTHEQLAQAFVDRAYGDAGIDAKLVKTNTLQYNYIVVYDYDYGTYDAYWIGGYNVGENVSDFISRNNSKMYYDLDYAGGNVYEDYYTGTQFEETTGTSKDLAKVAAIKQQLQIKKSAEKLKAEFGFSEKRSTEIARLAAKLSSAPKASMTDKDYDGFAKEIMGSTFTQLKSALNKSSQGNSADLNALVDQAAKVNGVGPEHMNQVLTGLIK